MVQLRSIVGAAALLSHSAFAAPAAIRRADHHSAAPYYQEQPSYEQPAYEQPEYEAPQEQYQESPVHDVVETSVAHATPTTVYEYVYPEHTNVENEYESEYAHDTTSVLNEEVEPTSTAEHVAPTYGSGSNEWDKGYQDCVAQCMQQYAPTPSYDWTPPAHDQLEQGGKATHVVMVAPEGGGLKYFPFALNATIGDVIRYVWTTPNNHTATLSSELNICNKSAEAEDRDFVSGIRNASVEEQVFDVVVETEEPQFFYCSVKEHCKKGMWGIINPASDFGGIDTVGSNMQEWVNSDPDLMAAWEYTKEMTQGTSVESWGSNINLQDIPEDVYPQVAANVLFTRANFAANPGMVELDLGAVTPDGSPVAIVSELNTLLSNASPDPAQNTLAPGGGSSVAPPGAVTTATSATPTDLPANASSAGSTRAMNGALLTGAVVFASWLLL